MTNLQAFCDLPIELEDSENDFRIGTILLTDKCNFECSYCYSQKGRSFKIISKNALKTAIDFIITNIVRRVNSSSNDEAKHRFTIDQSLESKKIISLEIYEIENIKYVI